MSHQFFGQSLADFEIHKTLGRGAKSHVYEVSSRKSGSHYALKIIDKSKLQGQNLTERLKDEIEIQSGLQHENILQLYEWFEDADSYYLVLELCKGGELGTFLKKSGKLSEKLTKRFMKDLLNGLQYLHS